MHEEGQEDVREGAARRLVGEQVLGDSEEGRVLQGRVEQDRDVPPNLITTTATTPTATYTSLRPVDPATLIPTPPGETPAYTFHDAIIHKTRSTGISVLSGFFFVFSNYPEGL